MKVVTKTKHSLLVDAFDVLLENLGPQKTLKFWQALLPPSGSYLKEREKVFKGKRLPDLLAQARTFNRS